MSKYFKLFPKTVYSQQDTPTYLDTITNLTTKVSFAKEFKENSSLYYLYVITDGETPEMLAHKIYGDSEKHWIILSMNDMFNPTMDWPIEQRSLLNIIENKYIDLAEPEQTGLEYAQQEIHSWYKIETQTNNLTNDKIVKKIQIDSNTYNNIEESVNTYTLQDGSSITIAITLDTKSFYDYEIDLNDAKRTIKILNPQFIPMIDEEFRRVLA